MRQRERVEREEETERERGGGGERNKRERGREGIVSRGCVALILPAKLTWIPRLRPQVTYVSEHSIEVKVDVYAENVLSGTKRMTNQVCIRSHLATSHPQKDVWDSVRMCGKP